MRFLSIDTETTGLDESWCQVLEIGVVIGDLSEIPVDDLPSLRMLVRHDRIQGEPYALSMNHALIVESHGAMGWSPESTWSVLCEWLEKHGITLHAGNKQNVAGKNFGSFDRRFLARLPRWKVEYFRHRALDPGSLFWRPGEDEQLPDTAECIRRAGIEWDAGSLHSAISDARLVVELVRAGAKRLEVARLYERQIKKDGG